MDLVHFALQRAYSDPHTRLGTGSRPCGVNARVSRRNGGWQRHLGCCGNEDERGDGSGIGESGADDFGRIEYPSFD